MAQLSIKVTKRNDNTSITVNTTKNGNNTIAGKIYAADSVMALTTEGHQDISAKLINSLGILILGNNKKDQTMLKKILAKTDAYFDSLIEEGDRYPHVGIIVHANNVQTTATGNVLISQITSVDVERPEEVLDLEAFAAVSAAKQQERNLSWAMRLSNIFVGEKAS